MGAFKIYKRLMDLFVKNDLIRIKKTGEVFLYETATGGANYSSYLVVNIGGTLIEYRGVLHVDDVEKVNLNGDVIEDFSQYVQQKTN